MTKLHDPSPRLRVALAGFGTVGEGVYNLIMEDAGTFEVVGILCRNPSPYIDNGGPKALLTDDPHGLPAHDILVEAIGGVSAAQALVLASIEQGAEIVSANKALFARRYDILHEAATRAGVRLRYSAAVGGGVPMLETIDEYAPTGAVQRIDAVLNGTTNFVLDLLGAGVSADDAIRDAQEAGFAEADPSSDIDGVDAAEKISLLARHAFGVGIDPSDIPSDRLFDIDLEEIRAAQLDGEPYKQVATAQRTGDSVHVEVRLRRTLNADPLSKPRLEENCLVVTLDNGERHVVSGKGAGREPTADSVFADLKFLTGRAPVLR